MPDPRLLPCSSCARHVRAHETTCPFCSAAITAPLPPAAALPRAPGVRLKRAAIYALGASTAALGACSSTSSTAVYGAPPADASAYLDAGDAGADVEGMPTPVYGAPADSGTH